MISNKNMRIIALMSALGLLAGCAENLSLNPASNGRLLDEQLRFSAELSQQNRHDEAEVVLRQLLTPDLSPAGRVSVFKALADIYQVTGRYFEAASAYREALLIRPDDLQLQTDLGVALTLGDDLPGAETTLRRVTQKKFAQAYSPLGVALDLQGKHIAAQAVYQEGLLLSPSDRAMQANLAMSYAIQGQYPLALGISEQLTGLLIADRYRRNHVLILLLANQPHRAKTEAAAFGLSDHVFKDIQALATRIASSAPGQGFRILSGLTL